MPADTLTPFVLTGTPVFDRSEDSALARSQGMAAAWEAACLRDPIAAARSLSGEFAIGLRLADGRAFLAVDRFASRSLCYRVDGNTLHFAERADALARSADGLDVQAVFDYLYFHVIPSPRTVFHGVQRLPPGCCLVFQGGRATVTPYWVPSFQEPRSASFTEKAAEFRAIVKQSVADQLDGSKPACFLSGGTDSSTVAGMLAQVGGDAPATYSIGFEAEGYDEMAYARLASSHFKTRHHEYYVTPDDLTRSIPAVAAHYDQPFGNSSAVPAYYCARMAKDDGVQRILAGDGGDELFGGNARYAKQRVFGLYQDVPAPLRSALLEPLLLRSPLGKLPLLRKGASYIEQALVPLPERMDTYNLLLRLGLSEVFDPGFLAAIDLSEPAAQQRAIWAEANAPGDLNRMLAFDWRYTLAEADLPKVVGTTGLAGLTVGFPLLDKRLVDFSTTLPNSFKLKGLKLRWFFKEALRGFLPDEILTKKKHGFGLPFGVWANRHQGLKALATDSLHGLGERGIVRRDFVQQLMAVHLPAHPGYYGEMVWILMMLEQWLRAHAPGFKLSAVSSPGPQAAR